MRESLTLDDETATAHLGAAIARLLRPGDAVLLDGPLGSGKTTLARALIRAASDDPTLEVPSPTYTLLQQYGSPAGPITHFDLWRLDGPEALPELGWHEHQGGIVVVEWPDRLGAARPADALLIRLEAPDATSRRATLSGWPPDRLARLGARSGAARLTPRTAILRASDACTITPALMTLSGRALIDRALDRLAAVGVERIFVEPQGAAATLARHFDRSRPAPDLFLLDATPADTPLATTVAALLGTARLDPDAPFFVIDGDVVWFDGPAPALLRLAHGFDPHALDGVLLLARAIAVSPGSNRAGLALDPLGFVRRPEGREITPFVFAGVQLLSPRLFDARPATDRIWDNAIAAHRLGGQVHDSDWFHIASSGDLAQAEDGFNDRLAGVRP